VLILARDFASRLATPVFSSTSRGAVIYAPRRRNALGRRYIEGGMRPVEPYSPLGRRRWRSANALPLEVAILGRHPDHACCGSAPTAPSGGSGRSVLFAHEDECLGAIAIFWETYRGASAECIAHLGCQARSHTGPETIRYGGNTSCVEVRGDHGEVIVLDAGTGARPLGERLMGEHEPSLRVDLLLTHLHVDHLEGLGMFAPIWSPETELHIWGPPSPSPARRADRHLLSPLFQCTEVPAR
jgi:hypothetical protein